MHIYIYAYGKNIIYEGHLKVFAFCRLCICSVSLSSKDDLEKYRAGCVAQLQRSTVEPLALFKVKEPSMVE